jgi:hypothetical protein
MAKRVAWYMMAIQASAIYYVYFPAGYLAAQRRLK